jgi:hypothetical protein
MVVLQVVVILLFEHRQSAYLVRKGTKMQKLIDYTVVKINENNHWSELDIVQQAEKRFIVSMTGLNHDAFSIHCLPTLDLAKRCFTALRNGLDFNVMLCIGCDTEENVKAYPARKGTTTNYCPSCYLDRFTVKAGA